MVDKPKPTLPAKEPIEASKVQGAIDSSTASLRYLVVILTAVPAILGFLQTKDIVGLIQFMRGTEGAPVIAAAVALGTAAYGIWHTHKRGAQVATVASDKRVPDTVAKLKV